MSVGRSYVICIRQAFQQIFRCQSQLISGQIYVILCGHIFDGMSDNVHRSICVREHVACVPIDCHRSPPPYS